MGRKPITTCPTCHQVIKEYVQTLDDVYAERLRLLIDAEIEIPEDVIDRALELEEKLASGRTISLSELQWLNQTIDKFELGG